MVGPSSLGVLNTAAEVSLNATFSGASVRPGGLAIGSHAVALGLGLLGHAAARQLGVSVLVALGSLADVSTNDLLEWCEDDERTTVVMLYVESFGDPERFTRIARGGVAREADPRCQGASTRRAGAQRSELADGCGAARRCGRRRGVASGRGAAVPQRRGTVRRRRAVREPAAAARTGDRDREQLARAWRRSPPTPARRGGWR